MNYTYGASSPSGSVSIGTDPYNFVARKMSLYMNELGEELYNIMNNNKDMLNVSGVDTNKKFSQYTVFLYYAYPTSKTQPSLDFHTYCIYRLADYQYDKRNKIKSIILLLLYILWATAES